ncbi:MAG: translation initiation factor IF-1A [Candidatus Altiarchaeota archaeon]|nr:translation initiation factor IF-1A [Candidatus Altiarchaeota archaeon]
MARVKKNNKKRAKQNQGVVQRVRTPRENEMYAIIEQRLGYNKMYVRCQDHKVRIGRVPGKYSRRLWIREGDLVIISMWEIERDKKCDIVYRYTAAQKEVLIAKTDLPEDMR